MLTKRTYSVPVLLVALALPAAAFAAGGNGGSDADAVEARPALADQRVGVAAAQPAAIASLTRPVARFERTILRHKQRVRAAELARRARLARQRREAFATLPGGVSRVTLDSIAACESGGSPTIVSSDGSYRGKYQFAVSTWESVGGSGDPAAAPEAEQDYRAALLYSRAGSSPWPVCGH